MSAPGPDTPRGRARWRRREGHHRAEVEVQRTDAEAEAARREAEIAQRRAEVHRAAAESTAYAVAKERDEALQRVAALEEQLNAALTDEPAGPEPVPAVPVPAEPAAAEPVADPAPTAELPELIEFGKTGGSAALTVLLGLGALGGAAVAVYLAVLDQLVSIPGLVASATTLVLALSVRRTGRSTTQVTIRRGTVVVSRPEGADRVDLTSPATVGEVMGSAGERDRRVVFVRRTKPPLKIDRSMVDVDAFVDAIRLWRPDL